MKIMGAIYNSIPTQLALELQAAFGLHAFVETGLGQGTSALWAEKHFDMVVSVEIDKELVDKFLVDYPASKVIVVCGDSAIEMIEIATNLKTPALFWLDAHTDEYTPVLSELAAINFSPLPHVIMIDDWRLFGTFPRWANQEKVITFATNKTRKVYDVDDVLVIMP
jgi:hypothetical protein